MIADGKSPSAFVPSLDYVLLFDVGCRRGDNVPTCHLLDETYATAYFSNQDVVPMVPREVYRTEAGELRPIPLISMTQRFVASGTSLKNVPCFNSRLMKVYRDLLVDMYTGELLTLDRATNDHVIPRSWGTVGRTRWRNNVTTDQKVNVKKADRVPEDCGLTLLMNPWRPTFEDMVYLSSYRDTGTLDADVLPHAVPRDEIYQVVDLHKQAMRDEHDHMIGLHKRALGGMEMARA